MFVFIGGVIKEKKATTFCSDVVLVCALGPDNGLPPVLPDVSDGIPPKRFSKNAKNPLNSAQFQQVVLISMGTKL